MFLIAQSHLFFDFPVPLVGAVSVLECLLLRSDPLWVGISLIALPGPRSDDRTQVVLGGVDSLRRYGTGSFSDCEGVKTDTRVLYNS